MHRIFSLALVGAVALAMGMGLGPVAAQDAGNETATANETEPPDPTGTPIDERLTLTGWSYSDGAFTLDFHLEGERPTMATISEATQASKGASRFGIKQQRFLPGNTTVSMPARTINGEAGVSITTSASIRDGGGVQISTGDQGGDDPFRNFGGTSGLLSGVGLSILMAGGAAAWVLRKEETGVIKA